MTSTGPQSHPRIAIIGGGPSGLVLLRTLYHRGIPATLYERETSFSSRAHLGGSLDLGWDSGQRALRENGLEDEFKRHSRPEGEEFNICDAAGNILLQQASDAHASDPQKLRPEIDRKDLRKILVDAVPADSIQWAHALSSVRPLDGGQHELVFTNGSTTICDILVGADGAHSRVRPLLSPAVPVYTGVTGAEVSLDPAVAARPELQETNALVGHGTLFAAQGGKFLGGQRNSDGRIRTYAWFRGPENWTLPAAPADARAALLAIFADWAPPMRKLIEHCDDSAVYHRPIYQLPVGHRWEHVRGVTLVGDAAHQITPFAGAGANLAMLDGLELGLALADAINASKGVDEREEAVAQWEEKMFASSGKMAAISLENMDAFVSVGAPESALEKAKSFIAQPERRREA